MSDDHYFTAQPASADERRVIPVTLAGFDIDVETAPGIFSPGHVDAGTAVLLRYLPTPPAGELLDLGCGWGPIALTAALSNPETRVTAVDVNERALDLLRRNTERIGSRHELGAINATTPDAVAADLRFDAIWSNPPIRIGKAALHDLLTAWIPRLKPGGEAHLVVQKNLGADSLATWIAAQRDETGPWGHIEKLGSSKGFRVLRLTRAS
ncbi:class I SAM-dependent methyltransferase [Demequina aurantiaca]|uniref:class I SAM-dependent methyltransferase n=1 Tax=Demequina aurantiaca TaxID=676200 RepID=UPI00078166F9|nr:methyltransferase [Demequina aurantiaca]